MTVDYKLEPSDLIALGKERQRFATGSSSRIYYFVLLPALGLIMAVVSESLTLATLFTLIYMWSGWLFNSWTQRRYRAVAYTPENLGFMAHPWRATLSEEGVTFSCDAAVALYRWAFVQDVVRGSHYIAFVLTPTYRVHIPVRAFSDDEHANQFLSKAKSYTKK